MKKYITIISLIAILIIFSGIAFAHEDTSNETIIMKEDIVDENIKSTQDIYTAENAGNFNQLNSEIESKNEIDLAKNYTYQSRYDNSLKNGIPIDKEVTINGNNFTIDGNGISTIFNVQNNGKLTLKNLCIINTFAGDSSMINNQGEVIFNNVNFTSHRSISKADGGLFRDIYNTGNLTIKNSNFIDSTFEITSNQYTNLQNLKIRGFIDNSGELYIENTLFDNNQFKPANKLGRSHEVSPLLYNNNPGLTLILNNIVVTNNKIQYTSSAQEVFRGLIRHENGTLIINGSLFENNTALFPESSSDCFGVLSANGNNILITDTIFKTNEFEDALITTYADNLTIMRCVFDSNTIAKNIVLNKGHGTVNITNNLFVENDMRKVIESSSSLTKVDENYWGTNNPNFRDIASLNYEPTFIILNFTGPGEVSNPETTYTLNLTRLNNNEPVNNNGLYDYYINVYSNNLRTTTPVDIKDGIGQYVYAPIDMGRDILSTGSIKFNVTVTQIFLTARIEIINEYANTVFAGTTNVINAKIFVNRDFGTYTIKVFADGVKIGEQIERLSRTPKDIFFTDELIRPINQTTVAGANNPQINYTVQVFANDNLIGQETKMTPLLYNGYLGKDYEYPINDVEFNYIATVNGDIIIQLQADTTYTDSSTTSKEYEWRTVLSDDSTFTSGFLYIPYNWDKTTTSTYPEFNLIFNNKNINNRVIGKYRDQANIGDYGRYGYGVLIYNVTDVLQNGRNTLRLEKENGLTAIYPPTLITMYNKTESDVLKTIHIKNGADLLYNSYNLANRPIESNAIFDVESLENITKAKLYVFGAGAGIDEADASFNDKIYQNIWENSTGTNYHGAFEADVLDLLKTTNHLKFISTGGTILALQNILVLEYPIIREKTQIIIQTEYPNTAYAGTNNTLTINIKVNESDLYTIKLLTDNVETATLTQELAETWMKFTLTDKTSRPIDETTVSGANNKRINYTIQLFKNDNLVANSTITVPLLYNGYLGKDYEYITSNQEFNYDNIITGDIIIQIKEDNTYLGLDDTNRIDYWEIELPKNSKITNSFLYISYNWDKTTGSEYPQRDLKFNGRDIENRIVGKYKDQSNLGFSGKYGYGLLIYDVSDLIYEGQNSLILKKEKGLTAIYPSALITLYNSTSSNAIRHVIINNDADLLFNSYNLANRSVQSNSLIEISIPEKMTKSTMYIFAASANAGDSDLKVNDNYYQNIWENYQDTHHNGVFKIDSTDIIKAQNTIAFISTGGTILSLQKIIVTEIQKETQPPKKTTPNKKKSTKKTAKTTPKLAAKKKTYKIKTKKKWITATLKNNKGKAIRNAKIIFKVKGKKYSAKTNKKGIAKIKVKIKKKGKYTVSVSFKGNNLYNSKTIKTKLTIKK